MEYQTLYLLSGDTAVIIRGSRRIKIESDLNIRVSILIDPDISFEGIPVVDLEKKED